MTTVQQWATVFVFACFVVSWIYAMWWRKKFYQLKDSNAAPNNEMQVGKTFDEWAGCYIHLSKESRGSDPVKLANDASKFARAMLSDDDLPETVREIQGSSVRPASDTLDEERR